MNSIKYVNPSLTTTDKFDEVRRKHKHILNDAASAVLIDFKTHYEISKQGEFKEYRKLTYDFLVEFADQYLNVKEN